MRVWRWFTLLWLVPLWGAAALYGSDLSGSSPAGGPSASKTSAKPAAKPKEGCGRFGTQVEFVSTPSEAARKARQQEKLVFILHVSGRFEDPRFT